MGYCISFLIGAAAFLLEGCTGSSSRSLRYFSTVVSEPGHGLPEFITVGYVDDQPFAQYDSNTRREVPRVPWIRKVEEETPQYWDIETQVSQGNEQVFRADVEKMKYYYNQSNGFHSVQLMYGCELSQNGHGQGYFQFGYNGRDHISFDLETLTWTAADARAQISKHNRDADLTYNLHLKVYLEKNCIEWLKTYWEYGKEVLQRTVPPVVQLSRKAGTDGRETLLCQAHGFYPKEIDANWQKDGEFWEEGTFRGVVAPNSDGTYYTLLGVNIDPKDRNRYQCHVEHDGLTKPLDVAWKELGFNMGLIIGCIMGAVVLLVVLGAGSWVYIKKLQDGYKAASTSDGGSNSFGKGSNPAI